MKANRNFDTIVKEQFRFLGSDYSCSLIKCKRENWGYELIYENEIVAVKIVYEFRESYIFITLYQLQNGELVENPGNIKEDTVLFGYGLDDIINSMNPSAMIKPTYHYDETSEYFDKESGLMRYISAFAINLKVYGVDVLSGDFRIFKEMDKIVKERAIRPHI